MQRQLNLSKEGSVLDLSNWVRRVTLYLNNDAVLYKARGL